MRETITVIDLRQQGLKTGLCPQREGKPAVVWVNTSRLYPRLRWQLSAASSRDTPSVNDVNYRTNISQWRHWNTSSAQGTTLLFRPIHCNASLLARATYTAVRLMYWLFWEIGTFYGHATYTPERPIVRKIRYLNGGIRIVPQPSVSSLHHLITTCATLPSPHLQYRHL